VTLKREEIEELLKGVKEGRISVEEALAMARQWLLRDFCAHIMSSGAIAFPILKN
jgi:hypothetical protein